MNGVIELSHSMENYLMDNQKLISKGAPTKSWKTILMSKYIL